MKSENEISGYDLDAESSVLGAMLIDPRAAEIAVEELTGDDFSNSARMHKHIFCALADVFSKTGSLDETLAAAALEKNGKLDRIGGSQYLGKLIVGTPTASNIEEYCLIVRERSEVRAILALAKELNIRAQEHRPSDEILSFIEESTARIWDRRLRLNGDPQDLHDLAVPVARDALELGSRDFWGLPCGIADGAIDELTGGFAPAQYTILASRTSMGKSTILNSIARGLKASNPGAGNPLVISTETSTECFARASLAASAGIHTTAFLKRNLGTHQREAVHLIIKNRTLSGVRVWYHGGPTIGQIRAVAKRHQRRYGLPLLVVDLAGKIKAPGSSEYERFSAVSAALAQLKGELNTCILAAVQINRSVSLNTDKRPELQHLKGSGSWEEDADRVLLLHRPGYYGEGDQRTEIIQAKDRDHGRLGSSFVMYQAGTGKFVRADE